VRLPRFTVILLRPRARAARSLQMSVVGLVAALALSVGAFGGVLWIGWKIGELTARL
jgi:hypothetical protein